MNKSKRENFESLWKLSGASVTHQFVRANGINTSYIEVGTGPVLLLLHGAGLGSVVWYRVVKSLSKHFRVICPDKPGYGESDNPTAHYDRKFYVDWLHDFTKQLSIDKFHLLGNSQGGAVSIQYTLKYPGQIDKLLLSNTAGISDHWSKWALGAIVGFHIMPFVLTGWNLGRYMIWKPENIDREWFEYSFQVVKEKGGRYPILIGMGRATSAFPKKSLQAIEKEVLVVWGKEERLFPVWHAKKAYELLPNAQLSIIENAGHMPFLDQPESFVDELLTFFEIS